MKKIIITLLIFFATKLIVVAQEITSPLTQLTTDIMTNEAKQNFNWHTVSNPNIAARIPNANSSHSSIILLMFDIEPDGDGGGTTGTTGSSSICPSGNWGGYVAVAQPDGTSKMCRECLDNHQWECPTVITGTNPSPTPPSDPDPTTSSDPFPPIGIPPGPIPPIGTYPAPTPSFPSGGGGGGGSTATTPPSVPQPTQPLDVDDPTGGTASQLKKDSIVYDTIPCNDSLSKRIGRRLDKDLKDCRNASFKVDSLYNYTLNAIPGTAEEGFTFGTDNLSNSIVTSAIFNNNDSAGVLLPFSTNYTTDKDFHTHFADGWYFPNIIDVYSLLIKTAVRNPNVITASYISCQDGSIFAITPTDRDAIDIFLNNYDKADNVDRNNKAHFGFKEGSELENNYFAFFKARAIRLGLTEQDAMTYAMAYLMASTQMGLTIYRANSINEPFHKITADMKRDDLTKTVTIILTKCN